MSTQTLASTITQESEHASISKFSWPYVRSLASRQLQKHSWAPAAGAIFSAFALATTLSTNVGLPYKLAAAGMLASTFFIWGYWKQASRRRLFPPLTHLQRRQYAATWDLLASSMDSARVAAAGPSKDEEEFRRSAATTIANLRELANIQQSDRVLEVGCGVGRIGEALSPHCLIWTGADVSTKMLGYASERLKGLANVRLVQLRRVGLSEFENGAFDVVYFTNMLMHVDAMDQWQYAKDSFRVLRPGGRIFLDIIDIESEAGWEKFTHDAGRYKHLERPPYIPQFSTASELQIYLHRAGFQNVQVHRRAPLVIVTGTKSSKV